MSHFAQLELFDATLFGRRPADSTRRRLQHRVYFALRPPEDIAMSIHAWAKALPAAKRRLTPAGNLHISTNGIGEFEHIPDDILSRANAAGCAVHCPCFEVVLDRIQAFGRATKRPVILRCAEGTADIALLRDAITAALQQQGLPTGPQPATPHLTLWYDQAGIPEQVLARPFRWLVRDFFLIDAKDAQPHQLPGRWPLDS